MATEGMEWWGEIANLNPSPGKKKKSGFVADGGFQSCQLLEHSYIFTYLLLLLLMIKRE